MAEQQKTQLSPVGLTTDRFACYRFRAIRIRRIDDSHESTSKTPVSTLSELPLYEDLSDSDMQQLAASLQQETSDIQKKFQELVADTAVELERCQVPLDKLIHELYCPLSFSKDTSLKDVFTVAATEGYWSFFSYEKMKHIIETFTEFAGKLKEYDSQFHDYCKRRLRRLPGDGRTTEEKVSAQLRTDFMKF